MPTIVRPPPEWGLSVESKRRVCAFLGINFDALPKTSLRLVRIRQELVLKHLQTGARTDAIEVVHGIPESCRVSQARWLDTGELELHVIGPFEESDPNSLEVVYQNVLL